MKKYSLSLALILVVTALLFSWLPQKEAHFITLASTTSTEDSGLLRALIPIFKAKTGINVRVIAVGTGQAFQIAGRGDADVLLIHDRKGEDEFIAKGLGFDRRDVMYNDFIVLGTKDDVAGIKGKQTIIEVMSTLYNSQALFASRGDDSGTHRLEMRLWRAVGLNPQGKAWYKELGSGMGASLNSASAMKAYIISDRASWESFKNKEVLKLLFAGDKALLNPYGSILVKVSTKPKEAKSWHEWLTSAEGKAAILNFRVDGQQFFYTTP